MSVTITSNVKAIGLH